LITKASSLSSRHSPSVHSTISSNFPTTASRAGPPSEPKHAQAHRRTRGCRAHLATPSRQSAGTGTQPGHHTSASARSKHICTPHIKTGSRMDGSFRNEENCMQKSVHYTTALSAVGATARSPHRTTQDAYPPTSEQGSHQPSNPAAAALPSHTSAATVPSSWLLLPCTPGRRSNPSHQPLAARIARRRTAPHRPDPSQHINRQVLPHYFPRPSSASAFYFYLSIGVNLGQCGPVSGCVPMCLGLCAHVSGPVCPCVWACVPMCLGLCAHVSGPVCPLCLACVPLCLGRFALGLCAPCVWPVCHCVWPVALGYGPGWLCVCWACGHLQYGMSTWCASVHDGAHEYALMSELVHVGLCVSALARVSQRR